MMVCMKIFTYKTLKKYKSMLIYWNTRSLRLENIFLVFYLLIYNSQMSNSKIKLNQCKTKIIYERILYISDDKTSSSI